MADHDTQGSRLGLTMLRLCEAQQPHGRITVCIAFTRDAKHVRTSAFVARPSWTAVAIDSREP